MNYEYTFKCAWHYEDTLNYKYAAWNITVINLYGMSGTKDENDSDCTFPDVNK